MAERWKVLCDDDQELPEYERDNGSNLVLFDRRTQTVYRNAQDCPEDNSWCRTYWWVAPELNRYEAIVRDLEDRLRLLAHAVCKTCRCAPADYDDVVCCDCFWIPCQAPSWPMAAAALSQGMRALCGRKLLPEPEGER